MEFLFVASVALVTYTYLLYPAAIIVYSRMRPRKVHQRALALPVAVVIPALNEGASIARKIRNILASDYPSHLLRIIVVSDGSSDDTVAQARTIRDARVRVMALPERVGKAAAVSRALAYIHEPIVVLTDAAELFERGAISFLVENFADPNVGAVSGQLKFVDLETGCSRNLGLYWRYEMRIRAAESAVSSLAGVTGAIYAIRRECFRAVPADTILDDVAIPLEVVLQGRRVSLEPRACAYEQATQEVSQEFARKRRTLAGIYQTLFRYWRRLARRNPTVAFQFFSHKACRLLAPHALIVAFFTSFYLPAPARTVALLAQAGFYGLAVFAVLARKRLPTPLLTLPYTFCVLNWAAMMSAVDYLRGRQSAHWEKIK